MRGIVAGTALLVLLCTAACTSTTTGSGTAVGGRPRGSTGAATRPSATRSATTSAPTQRVVPGPVPAPPACPGGTCKQTMSTTLRAPFAVVVRSNPAADGGAGASILELTDSGVPVWWYVIPGQVPSEITCSSTPSQSNCVFVGLIGSHGSDAIVFRLSGEALQRGSTVLAATRDMHARDLNDDNFVDAVGLQNTLKPDYASGKVYWQTWLSNGLLLTSTGCTALVARAAAQPGSPVHGKCP